MIKNLHLDDDSTADFAPYNNDDLELLRLGNLKSNILDKNPIFLQLRGKLVSFYKRLELHKEDPEGVKIDNLFLRTTLCDSLK